MIPLQWSTQTGDLCLSESVVLKREELRAAVLLMTEVVTKQKLWLICHLFMGSFPRTPDYQIITNVHTFLLLLCNWTLFNGFPQTRRAISNYSQPPQRCLVPSPNTDNKASAEITFSTLLYFISSTEGFSLPETINHRLLTVLNSLSYPPKLSPSPLPCKHSRVCLCVSIQAQTNWMFRKKEIWRTVFALGSPEQQIG